MRRIMGVPLFLVMRCRGEGGHALPGRRYRCRGWAVVEAAADQERTLAAAPRRRCHRSPNVRPQGCGPCGAGAHEASASVACC